MPFNAKMQSIGLIRNLQSVNLQSAQEAQPC
jgi:hypothetical protein